MDLRESKTEKRSFELLEETVKEYQKSPGNLLVLSNVEGAYMSPAVIEKTKAYAKDIFNKKA